MIKRIILNASLGLLFYIPTVQAEMVTYEFTANVVFYDDYGQTLNGSVNQGDTITGTYTIDTDTPNTATASYFKQYFMQGPQIGFDIQVGSNNVKTDSYSGCQGLQYYSMNNFTHSFNTWSDCGFTGSIPTYYASIGLRDPSATLLSGNEDINTPPPPLSNWQEKKFELAGPGYFIDAELISLQLAPPGGSGSSEIVEVTPAAGTFVAGQRFDLGLVIDNSAAPIADVNLIFNGIQVEPSNCASPMDLEIGKQAMLCANFWMQLIPGQNTLNYEVYFMDGSSFTDSVQWNMLLPAY